MIKNTLKILIVSFFCSSCAWAKSPVFLSEIFPNPSGADQEKEWIELYNDSSQTIDLNNWKISTNKEFLIENTQIGAHSHKVIKPDQSLPNNESLITLLDPNNQIIDSVHYQKAPENQSYTHVIIVKNQLQRATWLWTKPTKAKKNPIFYQVEGEIASPPQIDTEYYFTLTTKNQTLKVIISNPQDLSLLTNLLKTGTKVQLLTQKQGSNHLLIDYNILNSIPEPTPKSIKEAQIYLLIPISFLIVILIGLNYINP